MAGGIAKSGDDKPTWDPTFEPLMKVVLGKKGIKTKPASEVGKKKVDYFRGKDFKKFVCENHTLLKKKCSPALKLALDGGVPESDADVERLGDELISRGFCFKAMYKPINPKAESGSTKKWPDRLQRTTQQKFDTEGYYIITYEGGSGLRHLMLGLIIAGVLLACMFPVWPIWAKIGMWYLSVIFLVFYFGILIVRLIVFTLFWIVGVDFWIFPNINDDDCGILASFQPFYSWDRRKDDAWMLLVRFVGLAITAMAVQQIAETHSLSDITEFVESSWTDVIDWGIDKIVALPGSEKQALPSLEQLKEQQEREDKESAKPADGPIDDKWVEGAEATEDDDEDVVDAS